MDNIKGLPGSGGGGGDQGKASDLIGDHPEEGGPRSHGHGSLGWVLCPLMPDQVEPDPMEPRRAESGESGGSVS